MHETTIIGIDCATDPRKIGLAKGIVRDQRCVVATADTAEQDVSRQIAQWLTTSDRALLAFDAPLGWPRPMGQILATHRAGQPIPDPPNDFFRRKTDQFIKRTIGKQPLDVGADRIARTAHAALNLLQAIRDLLHLPIPLAWESDYDATVAAIEVYPAATLCAHQIPSTGYKKPADTAIRTTMIGDLGRVMELPQNRAGMTASADALDAAVCILAGYDFLAGHVHSPPAELRELAEKEGWIWVRSSLPQ